MSVLFPLLPYVCLFLSRNILLTTFCCVDRQCLEKLKNFNGVIEVMTALQSSPVYRLKDTAAVRLSSSPCSSFFFSP